MILFFFKIFSFIFFFNFKRRLITVEPSYTIFSGIIFGRMSFNGYNPQIEVIIYLKCF